jgi:hypothetical protein
MTPPRQVSIHTNPHNSPNLINKLIRKVLLVHNYPYLSIFTQRKTGVILGVTPHKSYLTMAYRQAVVERLTPVQ